MASSEYDKLLDSLAKQIHDPDIRSTLTVVSARKLYPRDCITNGSIEQLMRKIIAMEAKIERYEHEDTP